jgi:hypothetical protein
MTEKEIKRHNTLFVEFQNFLGRSLTKKEKEFIKWMIKRNIEFEHYKAFHDNL